MSSTIDFTLFNLPPRTGLPDAPAFGGRTFEPKLDAARLTTQYETVFNLMRDGAWRTPAEMEAATGFNWSSINARLRDARKETFGAHDLQRERVGDGTRGLFRYRLVLNKTNE